LLGAVPFSIYNTFAPEQVRYALDDSGARIVVAEASFVPKLTAARDQGALFEELLVIDTKVECHGDLTVELEAEDSDFDFRSLSPVAPDDLLTLIYTSGTTGPPKGVELTHRGMLEQLRSVHAVTRQKGGGRQVSFLPAAHVADRWASHYSAFMTYANTVTTVADAATNLPAAVVASRPTMFGAVPRVWEKFKGALEASHVGDVLESIAKDPKLAASLRTKLGLDAAEWLMTGAAPTPIAVIEFFTALGLPLCEVLGMSEASGCVSVNTPEAVRPGSVGRPLSSFEVRIADDGELLLRGPQVMRGYRGQPEKTAEALDADGWLHTGDVARVDDDGFLWIVDRKKELIINASGKNMSPANIEMALRSAGNLISQVAVIGDSRPYNVALVVLESSAVAGRPLDDPGVLAELDAQIDRGNSRLARVEQIKRFAILAKEWTPELELTPTMKLKRRVIAETYAAEIESLYAQS